MLAMVACQTFGQINIVKDKPASTIEDATTENATVWAYDSLTNITVKMEGNALGYRHLIGQTLLYTGVRRPELDAPELEVGESYTVKDVRPTAISSSMPYYTNAVLVSKKDGKEYTYRLSKKANTGFVCEGYYEKMKRMHVGKQYILPNGSFTMDTYGLNGLYNVATDNKQKDALPGSEWQCVDISVKITDSTRWSTALTDLRSPVILTFENTQLGKAYAYLEGSNGARNTSNTCYGTYTGQQPMVCGLFVEPARHTALIAQHKQDVVKRAADLTKRFGKANADMIQRGEIKVGMSADMCLEAIGRPKDVTTTKLAGHTIELWTYEGRFVHFTNGKITAIQTH